MRTDVEEEIGRVGEYDIPDIDRIKQMLNSWSYIQWHAYITDLYKGLKVRDKEIEELKAKVKKKGEVRMK